jgi:UDP-N-acetylmuramoyl-tripeptide--D-alanyl-D-alanine ligase
MNHPGEIATLAAMTKPTIALVNNAQREHLEFMQTVAAVALENGAVISALPASGVAVFPADDDYTPLWRELAGARQVSTFSLDENIAADVSASAQWQGNSWLIAAKTPAGALHFGLFVAGRHNVKNALAAATCALAAGAPLTAIAKGLQDFEPVKGRSRSVTLSLGAQPLSLVDDSYNANPDSMRAAIAVLAELPGPRLLVVGDMAEVGDQGPQFHAEAGEYARASGIEQLFCLGPQSVLTAKNFGHGRHFSDMDILIAAVSAALPSVRSLLVKGSRAMKMEQVVQAIEAAHDNQVQDNAPHAKETPHAA